MANVFLSSTKNSSNITLSNGNLTAVKTGSLTWASVQADTVRNSERWYFEAKIDIIDHMFIGIGSSDFTLNTSSYVGYNIDYGGSIGFGTNSSVIHKDAVNMFTPPVLTNGDILGVLLDADSKTVSFYRNGITVVEDLSLGITSNLVPMVSIRNTTGKVTLNFGATPFAYEIPRESTYSYDGSQYRGRDRFLLKSNNKIYSLQPNEILHETKMTSNNTPAPFVVSASSVYSAEFPAWKAFNGQQIVDNYWASSTVNRLNCWLMIDYGTKKKVNYFVLGSPQTAYSTQMPKDFIIQGSSDGVSFKDLGTFKNQTNWGNYEKRKFCLNNVWDFRYYRIFVLDNNGNTTASIISILEFGYIENLTQLPSDSIDNYIKYGASSIEYFNAINTNKNYVLSNTESIDTDGLRRQELNRKPLSIKFE